MADFTSSFWSLFVAAGTLVSIVACGLLLLSLSRRKVASDPDKTGHVWDEDLDEYNNPLPMWWIWLFWITIAFSLGYLWLYPGLGTWQGSTRWSSAGQYHEEVKVAEAQYGPLYAKLASVDLATLSTTVEAKVVGEKLFVNYCSQCHSADGRGAKGFPNLTDADWLYGGEPETIKASILNGRNGTMPAMGAALGAGGSKDMANYVRSLSGLAHDKAAAERARPKFAVCAACHGAEAKGNPAVGAPNLTDATWLYGSSEATLAETIEKGRANVMPAHKDFLGEQRSHILAAYVYGLSRKDGARTDANVLKVNTAR
ncbi:MAG TPA: cytochrome-c oxidase, cbb3-type subunit III [Usitatibacter sp.]|nr:cytochrome-c oxidase, cbb3-type subunit III [Usitatibacter sp.]